MNLNIGKGAFQILAWFSSYSWEHDIPTLGTIAHLNGNFESLEN